MTYEQYLEKLAEVPYGKLGFTIGRLGYEGGPYVYQVYRGKYVGYIYDLRTPEEAIEQVARQFNLDKSVFIRPSWWTDELEPVWEKARDLYAHH